VLSVISAGGGEDVRMGPIGLVRSITSRVELRTATPPHTKQLRVEDEDDENEASGDLGPAPQNSEVVLSPIFWSKSELLFHPP
jgi:hypothetical protein